jgi:thiosulfate/3-mercaptopyruvate sulfurtransferase
MKTSILLLTILSLLVTDCSSWRKKSKNNNLLLGILALTYIPVRTASELVNESNSDYTKNNYGLIEGSTLARWVSDWSSNKPAGITGKLVILQTDAANRITGDSFGGYIKEDTSKGVYVYLLDDYVANNTSGFRFNQTRSSGLFKDSVRYQANGAFVDEWLKNFGIDPTKDLIVFAVGTANGITGANVTGTTKGSAPASTTAGAASGAGGVQDIARGVYWLRYWGVDIKNLAILNGNIRSNFAPSNPNLLSSSRSVTPYDNGGFSVKRLRVDNTIITLGLEDVYAIAEDGLNSTRVTGLTSKQFLIDARPSAQFNKTTTGASGQAGEFITTAFDSSGPPVAFGSDTANKNYLPTEGYIKGAVTFPWLALLEGISDDGTTVQSSAFETGYRFKNKSNLESLFKNKGYTAGATVISQCRTNFEAQVNGFAAINILGYPTSYYDGSLAEWTALNAEHPVSSLNSVPADFKWRTDKSSVSNYSYTNNSLFNSRLKAAIVDRTATTTRLFITEDKAYKNQ